MRNTGTESAPLIRPRNSAWFALQNDLNLDTQSALASRIDIDPTELSKVLNHRKPVNDRFIARTLTALPFASFERLFELTGQ